MNVNRQNNCNPGRPNVIVNQGCCNTVPVPAASCCSNTNVGNIIVGSGFPDAACNKETAMNGFPIAMAYVPWQDYGNIYAQPQALRNGTLFAELNLDFAGRRCN